MQQGVYLIQFKDDPVVKYQEVYVPASEAFSRLGDHMERLSRNNSIAEHKKWDGYAAVDSSKNADGQAIEAFCTMMYLLVRSSAGLFIALTT
jgi:hypothetical protein